MFEKKNCFGWISFIMQKWLLLYKYKKNSKIPSKSEEIIIFLKHA